METYKIEHLSFSYPECREKAIDDLSLSIAPGEFLVVCGPSGCGKSTLLRQLKTTLAPQGSLEGNILFEGRELSSIAPREQSQRIGFVLQSPENQIVTDKVWHELAFGLESLGYDTPTIRRRVAEMASFFGIENWFHKNVNELSGGQKQLLNLASVMAMQPSVLILDEPTSQLDPIAAGDFLATVAKINRELGTTVILTEHRLEDALPLASKVLVLEKGRMLCTGTPAQVGAQLKAREHSMFLAMPAAMRIWAAVDSASPCPITVREGRSWLSDYSAEHRLCPLPAEEKHSYPDEIAIDCREMWFKYEKDEPDVVKGLSLSVKKGEFVALLGGNGTGKSTTLKLLAGILAPIRGKVNMLGTVGVLPQNPQTLFAKSTLREDITELCPGYDEAEFARIVKLCRLEELLDRHPYDLSGGEQQRAALAKVLLPGPGILLMDEPTKGLDAEFKLIFAQILQVLLRRGVTILMVSHDIEFCARYAHRCALFFDGGIVTEGTPRSFFAGNSFYTTASNRIARSFCPEAVTAEDVIALCSGKLPPAPQLPEDDFILPPPAENSAAAKPKPLPFWRKLIATVCAIAVIPILIAAYKASDFTSMDVSGPIDYPQLMRYIAVIAAILIFAMATSRKSAAPVAVINSVEKQMLSRRTIIASVLALILVPFTLFLGLKYFSGNKYYILTLLILLECMAPFFLIFEGRKPQARELVTVAVLCAIGVAGRSALFMIPQCEPVMALTIIVGVAFGGETGFLVGAMTMLCSNFFMGQGPWTPWQMFAMGIIGFLAGMLFRKGLLRRTKGALCTFSIIACVIIYGGIINPAYALLYSETINPGVIIGYYLMGFVPDCIHAATTAVFMWFIAEPMLEKLDRIKVKYALVQ